MNDDVASSAPSSFGRYVLKDRVPVPEPDLLTWCRWFEDPGRVVKQQRVGPIFVSTVFLGLDHNYSHSGPPLLFESMVSVAGEMIGRARCATWAEAEALHADAVVYARAWWCR